ncbi:MAG TPA: carboxymuconolactone decarboxylase family protein [Rickettsiales bacterium]|nr:carboxymuconolactone decarboxylase family protein [Rickettsiales bacterium]
MKERLNFIKAAPSAYKAMSQLEQYIRNCGLEMPLIELVKIRSSQINGCGYCLDMHTKDARAAGETEQRIYVLPAWREAPFYTPRERAALEWAETVTLVSQTHVPDEVYERVKQQFTEEELVNLTLVINTINSWNRLVISFRPEVGGYHPGQHAAA